MNRSSAVSRNATYLRALVSLLSLLLAVSILYGHFAFITAIDTTAGAALPGTSSLVNCPSVSISGTAPQKNETSVVSDTTEVRVITATGIDESATCDDLMHRFYEVGDRYQRGEDDSASAPLVNFAWYKNQGFGRLIDHSMLHCILALTLDRPFVIDMSTRDPFFTWRSFIRPHYDWEVHGRIAQHKASIDDAIDKLKLPGDNDWEDPLLKEHYTDILPMQRPAGWNGKPDNVTDFWPSIEQWRADRTNNKVLLSPNWGTAFFPQLKFPESFGTCSRNELNTHIQNALYEPTPLAHSLHDTRRKQVLPNPDKPYGAIHVRVKIIELRSDGEEKMRHLQQMLLDALDMAQSYVKDWWILSDTPEIAMQLTKNITKYRLHEAYSLPDNFTFAEAHSALPQSRGLFAHEAMAPSIMDWMVLHESAVAVITEGSYGETGARGRGKIHRGRKKMFNIYK